MTEVKLVTTEVGKNGNAICIGDGATAANGGVVIGQSAKGAGGVAIGTTAGDRNGSTVNGIDIKSSSNSIFIGNSGNYSGWGQSNSDYVVFKVGGDELVMTKSQFVRFIDRGKALNPIPYQDGTEQYPYLIESVSDLQTLKQDVAEGDCKEGKYFRQEADIDMSGVIWEGIGLKNGGDGPDESHTFKGIYDGAGHSINNLKFAYEESGDYELMGFFRTCSGATIKNLTINVLGFNVPASPSNNFGGAAFVGTMTNGITMINCTANGNIGSSDCPCLHTSAGIIANIEVPTAFPSGATDAEKHSMYKTVLSFVTNNANVFSARKAGGIIGLLTHDLEMNTVVNNGAIRHLFVKPNKTTDGVGAIYAHASGNSNGWYSIVTWNGVANTGIVDSDRNVRTDIIGQLVGSWSTDSRSRNIGDVKFTMNDKSLPLAANTSGGNMAAMNIFFGEILSDGFCHVVKTLKNGGEYIYLVVNQGEQGSAYTPPAYVLASGTTVTIDQRFGAPLIKDSNNNTITGTQIPDTTKYTYTAA